MGEAKRQQPRVIDLAAQAIDLVNTCEQQTAELTANVTHLRERLVEPDHNRLVALAARLREFDAQTTRLAVMSPIGRLRWALRFLWTGDVSVPAPEPPEPDFTEPSFV
jgi:hypothetical protein